MDGRIRSSAPGEYVDMKFSITVSLIIIVTTLSSFAQSSKNAELKTVASVDLNKYAGLWYEIAKYPNKFQKQCVGNTTANYVLKGEGKIEVQNRCLKSDGSINDATGAAKVNDPATSSKLKVRFAPSFLSFLPVVWADYWVIDLAQDYSYSVVGTPDRDYLWILGRQPVMTDAVYQEILRRVEKQGFVPARLEKTPQGVESGKGSALTKS